ncbi:MAG: small basic protein [Candidatus Omnitrophica bacterium]|nr:small basic protein [Candidatus Omnitrophota bacterium]
MTQHSSLRGEGMGSRHRNVLKRYERIKKLREEEKWKEERSVFGLPKVKSIKVKVRKAKAAEKAEGAAAGGVATGAAGQAEPAAASKAVSKTAAPAAEKKAPPPKKA